MTNNKNDAKHIRYQMTLLSVSILTVLSMPKAYAQVNDTNVAESSNDNPSESVNQQAVNKQELDDQQLENTLIALRLKQAVEAGIIEAEVLEDFKRNTLNIGASADVNKQQMSDETVNNAGSNNNLGDNGLNTNLGNGNIQEINTIEKPTTSFSENSTQASQTILDNHSALMSSDVDNNQVINFEKQHQKLLDEVQTIRQSSTNQSIQQLDEKAEAIASEEQAFNGSTAMFNGENVEHIIDAQSITPVFSTNLNNEIGEVNSQLLNDSSSTVSLNNNNHQSGAINPDDYLPKYQVAENEETSELTIIKDETESTDKKQPGFFQKLYARFFSDGYVELPKIDTKFYLEVVNDDTKRYVFVNTNNQPVKNIKAALEDIFVESISDFNIALPKIRKTATNAANAVGYYDVKMRFERVSASEVEVILEEIGEPVLVDGRIIDIRGEGQYVKEYQELIDVLRPYEGEAFNHGMYDNSKVAIETLSSDLGFFDSDWINKSVDIILPDNKADISLIYGTGNRYKFGDVVFYTRDEKTNQIVTDITKLPISEEILEQLIAFKSGDDYDQQLLNKFINDLSATRYFNELSVDTTLPDNQLVGFDVVEYDINEETTENVIVMLDENGNGQVIDINELNNLAIDDPQVNGLDQTVDAEADIDAIFFNSNAETLDKFSAIQEKANQLYNSPDDRVLAEQKQPAKNLIGQVSDGISKVAKTVLPKEEEIVNTEFQQDKQKLIRQVTPEQVYQTKTVPVYVYVRSNKPRDAQFGLGYGTDTGVRVTSKLDYNLINRDGYKAGFQSSLSKISKSVTVYASKPWKHPLEDTLNANLTYSEEKLNQGTGNFDLTSKTLQTNLSRNVIKDSGWNRAFSLQYRLDKLETGVDAVNYKNLPVKFTSGKLTQQALLLGYGISKTVADDIANPKNGYRQYYSLSIGAEGVVTDTNMAIARAGLSGIYSYGDDSRHQLLGKVDLGYLWADKFEDVPYNLRFFAGGDQSIRGYDYHSLSPIENGYLTGGEVYAVASAEYNYEVVPKLRVAVFTDIGNAYDSEFTTETKVGTGVGIRWASPVGPVRLDLAAGVTEEDIPWRLHFFIGSPL